MKPRHKSFWDSRSTAVPAIVLLSAAIVLPIVVIVLSSFSGDTNPFQYYYDVIRSPAVRQVSLITLQISVATTAICLLIGFAVAYHAVKTTNRRRFVLFFLVAAPLLTPTVVRLYSWTVILGRKGVINSMLMSIGLISEPLDLLFTRTAVVTGMTHILLPYVILIMYGVLAGLDPNLEHAAESLGASPWAVFRRVVLPLSKPGIYASTLLILVLCVGFFATPAILGGASGITVALYMQQQVSLLLWGPASALGTLVVGVTLAGFWLFDRKYSAAGLLVGGSRK